jgi:hypothetical protein
MVDMCMDVAGYNEQLHLCACVTHDLNLKLCMGK